MLTHDFFTTVRYTDILTMEKPNLKLVYSATQEQHTAQSAIDSQLIVHNPDNRYTIPPLYPDTLLTYTADCHGSNSCDAHVNIAHPDAVQSTIGDLLSQTEAPNSSIVITPPAINSQTSIERAWKKSEATKIIALQIGKIASKVPNSNIIVSDFAINHSASNATASEIALHGAMDNIYHILLYQLRDSSTSIQRIILDPVLMRDTERYSQLREAYAISVRGLMRHKINQSTCVLDDRQYSYNLKK